MLALQEQGVEVEEARGVVEDGDDEREVVVAVLGAADDVGGLVPEEEGREHLDLEVLVNRPRAAEVLVQRAHEERCVAREVGERAREAEARDDLAERRREVARDGIPLRQYRTAPRVAGRVPDAVGRLGAEEVLGRYGRAHEDVLVPVVSPVQDAARDRVEEGLGALGLPVVVEQRDVRVLDRGPERLVARGIGVTLAERDGRLDDALVVHRDACRRGRAGGGPVCALEAPLGGDARLAKQAVVPVEAGEDGPGDVGGEGHRGARPR